jgi:hypothetical protein
MKKIGLVILLGLVLVLSGCDSEAVVYNFQIRKDSYYISEDHTVIIDYKTNEDGKMVELFIDRLLTIEDFIYYNSQIDIEEIEAEYGEVFTEAGFLCTDYEDLMVPINIEVGNTRFKYDYVDCEYTEVDRDNDEKTGSFVRRYLLDEPIDVSLDTIVSIVKYDPTSIERFVEVRDIPTTMKNLGVYSIGINVERDDFTTDMVNYYHDISIYEQIFLKTQSNDDAILEMIGFSADINLFDLDSITDLVPLVDNFDELYGSEITALEELEAEIGAITEEANNSAANEDEPTDGEEVPTE